MRKSTLCAIVLTLAAPLGAFAQEAGTPPPTPNPGDQTNRPAPPRHMRKLPKELIAKFDADKDGKLNREERQAMWEDWAQKHPEEVKKMQERRKAFLDKYDTDKDGKLNKEERQAMRKDWAQKNPEIAKKFEEHHKAMLDKYDVDKDGKLSREEFREMRQDRQANRPGPHHMNHDGKRGPHGPHHMNYDGKRGPHGLNDESRDKPCPMAPMMNRGGKPCPMMGMHHRGQWRANRCPMGQRGPQGPKQGWGRALMILGPTLLKEKYDADKDGKLSKEEKATMHGDVKKAMKARHDKMSQKKAAKKQGKCPNGVCPLNKTAPATPVAPTAPTPSVPATPVQPTPTAPAPQN